jgi:hypothetical protein
VVDDTISPRTVVDGLLDKLTVSEAELVLFDVNRSSTMLPLLAKTGELLIDDLHKRSQLPFDLTVVGSDSVDPRRVSVRQRHRGENDWNESATDMTWPRNVYSLSHVALPFNSDDPVYGVDKADGLLRLGEMWFKGERGVFGVPLGLLVRQRYNPFYPYLESRVIVAAQQVVKRNEVSE